MKRLSVVAVVVAGVSVAVSVAAQRSASVPDGRHIAHVSGQRLSRETNEGKAGLTRLQALQQERAADIRAKQQALELVRQQLGRAGTDAATRTRLEQEDVQRRVEFESAVAQSQVDIQNLQRQLSADLMAKVRPILEELVAGTDVQIVLQSDGPVLWAVPGLDLTAAVIERLNGAAIPAGRSR